MNTPMHDEDAQIVRRNRLRFTLGLLQMAGVTITLIIYLNTGSIPALIWGTTLTGMVSLISIFLLRVKWKNGKSAGSSPRH